MSKIAEAPKITHAKITTFTVLYNVASVSSLMFCFQKNEQNFNKIIASN